MNQEELSELLKNISYLNKHSPKYTHALHQVIKVRLSRQQQYGEGWLGDPIEYDLWMLWGKWRRLHYILTSRAVTPHQYEKVVDTVIDLVNYGLFLLAKLLERGE